MLEKDLSSSLNDKASHWCTGRVVKVYQDLFDFDDCMTLEINQLLIYICGITQHTATKWL